MKMDRDVNKDGKGKYAVVRLRGIEAGSPAHEHLKALYDLGVLDWGRVGDPDEFFLIRLKDKYAGDAIRAYSDAAAKDAGTVIGDEAAYKDRMQWSLAVQKLGERSGILSLFCKQPD